jgi:predicted peptidase
MPAGEYNQRLALPDGESVHVALSVPASYEATKPVPLVLALHFGGDPDGAGRAMLDILIRPAFRELGAIIVAPDSLEGGWSTPANERAVQALLVAVKRAYTIDVKRVVVTGFSMGGAGAWYWAQKYPSEFSAVVPVSGRPVESSAPFRLPVFAVHSRADEVNPIGPTEQRIEQLKARGVNAQIVVVSGISHYETGRFASALRQAVPWLRAVWMQP